MKHESSIRSQVRKLKARLEGCSVGSQEHAACTAMIGALRWVTNKRNVFDPESYAVDAMIDDLGVLKEDHPSNAQEGNPA